MTDWESIQLQVGKRNIKINPSLSNLELVQMFVVMTHEISIFNQLESGEELQILSGQQILKSNEQTYLEVCDNAKYCHPKLIQILKLRNFRIRQSELSMEQWEDMYHEELNVFVGWNIRCCLQFIEENKI
jgi:hypothetical protein